MNKSEIINRTLVTNAGVSNRSEDLKHYSELFVDPIESDILLRNTKQLIYGRRGSGKTLLIGALNEALQRDITKTKVMSFSYSAINFRSSAEYGGLMPTVKEKTHAYFHSFIVQLSGDIFNLADNILRKPSLLDYFKLNGPIMTAKREQLATAVLELMEASSYGSEHPLPTSLKILQESTSTNQKKGTITAGIKTESAVSLGAGCAGQLQADSGAGAQRGTGFAARGLSGHRRLGCDAGRRSRSAGGARATRSSDEYSIHVRDHGFTQGSAADASQPGEQRVPHR